MRGKKGIKLSILLTIGILIGSSLYSVNATDIQPEEKTQQSSSSGGDLSTDMETIEGMLNLIGDQDLLDFSFITGIIESLDSVIDLNPAYWRSREFGTEGAEYTANYLCNIWNNQISKDNDHVNDAIKELVDNGDSDFIDNKVDVQSNEDFYLKVKIDGSHIYVPYTEFFPVHPMSVSENNPYVKSEFLNAELHTAPSIVYNLGNLMGIMENQGITNFEEVTSEQVLGYFESTLNVVEEIVSDENLASSQPQAFNGIVQNKIGENNLNIAESDGKTLVEDTDNHIYLIEMEKMTNMPIYSLLGDYTFVLVAAELKLVRNNADAFLCSDYNDDTHFMAPFPNVIPGFMINGSLGAQIKNSINLGEDVRADFILNSTFYSDVVSHNVIGEIPGGLHPDQIIIIGAHYDSWWCRGTNDNGNAVAIIWGIAKYYADNNIIPDYTLKFAAWTGEEHGWLGSTHYVMNHILLGNEQIRYYVNLDVVGQKNCTVNGIKYDKSDMDLVMGYTKDALSSELQNIVEQIDYSDMSDGYNGVLFKKDPEDICNPYLLLTDTAPFSIPTVTEFGVIEFHKGYVNNIGEWYHRRGSGNTKGDTIDFVDWGDVEATAEVVLATLDFLDTASSNSNQQDIQVHSMPSSILTNN